VKAARDYLFGVAPSDPSPFKVKAYQYNALGESKIRQPDEG
jgi:hypothetical protein